MAVLVNRKVKAELDEIWSYNTAARAAAPTLQIALLR
jgi:hypothetical protein